MSYIDHETGKKLTKSKNTYTTRWRWNIRKDLFRWIDKELAEELVRRGSLSKGENERDNLE